MTNVWPNASKLGGGAVRGSAGLGVAVIWNLVVSFYSVRGIPDCLCPELICFALQCHVVTDWHLSSLLHRRPHAARRLLDNAPYLVRQVSFLSRREMDIAALRVGLRIEFRRFVGVAMHARVRNVHAGKRLYAGLKGCWEAGAFR